MTLTARVALLADYTTAEQVIDRSVYDVIVRGENFQVIDDDRET